MKKQNLVQDGLDRLRDHFGRGLLLYPPLSSDALGHLEEIVGSLPSDLVVFLQACNGLRVNVEGREDAHIWSIPEVLASTVDPGSSIVPRCFLPFRGDPTGERDWVVMGFKPAFGAVVRWDPWRPTIKLIASSLGQYMNAWANYMIARYRADGSELPLPPKFVFGTQPIDDPGVAKLNSKAVVTEWLARIAEAATCEGTDCKTQLRMQYALCGPEFGKQSRSQASISN